MDFVNLLRTEWDRKHDKHEARESLYTVKVKLAGISKSGEHLCTEHNPEGAKNKINIGSFKIALNSLRCLNVYQMENLTKYLDT